MAAERSTILVFRQSPPLAVPAASSQERKGNIEEKIARNKVIYYNENVCLAGNFM